MKHNLATLKYKMERFPETIEPYDYLLRLMDELREILKFATMYKLPSDYPRDAKLILKILGDEDE